MSIHAPLTVTGGKLVLPDGRIEAGNIRCEGGFITAIGDVSPQAGDIVHQAGGKLVTPGLVDVAVFSIDKPAFHFGGVTRAALMPDQDPPLDVPARVRFAAQSGKPDFWVHPLAAATKNLEGDSLAEIALMRDAGARAVATGRSWIRDSGTMLRLLQYAGMLDMVVVTHAEDSGLVGKAVATAGEMATRLGLPSAPAEAEALAIARDIALAELAGAKIHFRKVTTAAGVDLVRRAKDRGAKVTAGVSPAYFMLSDLALANFRTFAHLSPPLRSEADRKAVIAAIADGTIDMIGSGHDPRGPEDKRLPYADSAPGMAGSETLLPLTMTLVRDGVISMNRAFDLLAGNPAKLLGVNAGCLAEGKEADIAVIDPDRPWIVDSDEMAAAAGNTPFDKQPVQGRVLALFKGGMAVKAKKPAF
ncbi:dihydroorotase [Novosphingobium pentaromativorans]|uniref:Dihydroorotase n=1 Tax=Novosphingobium pentaromativorans US6-1 TaxID=1088721 RepID=G6E8N9_9SPHN|nr:dihydroorotase [Novosphingobium pentaromativorans]AIT81278.1 dihydroorotase [Novosphingobium pentaromativorans US6-1]EHJ62113.1 dihydroorotase [Novosphingobium pentaromativorans US6-1]